jgi:imidazole glycerol phosphate synthase subunit HisF
MMSMSKREIAVASTQYAIAVQLPDNTWPAGFAENIIDNLIHDGIITLTYAGNPDVSTLVDAFQIAVGNTAVIRTDRFAAARLAKRYGLQVIIEAIQAYGRRKNEKYAPTVNSLTGFEQKWPQIERFVSSGEGLDV